LRNLTKERRAKTLEVKRRHLKEGGQGICTKEYENEGNIGNKRSLIDSYSVFDKRFFDWFADFPKLGFSQTFSLHRYFV
jgi:hypothetical protein